MTRRGGRAENHTTQKSRSFCQRKQWQWMEVETRVKEGSSLPPGAEEAGEKSEGNQKVCPCGEARE